MQAKKRLNCISVRLYLHGPFMVHGVTQQVSVQAPFGELLQQGGALASVQCAMHAGAWLLGGGVVGFAATKGTVVVRSAATIRVVMAILRTIVFI